MNSSRLIIINDVRGEGLFLFTLSVSYFEFSTMTLWCYDPRIKSVVYHVANYGYALLLFAN